MAVLLLTLAYAQVLQYRVEKVRPPTLGDYHPLVMSVVEFKQQVEGHITFSKQAIFHNLGVTTNEVRSGDTKIPQEGTIASPTTPDVGGTEPHPTET